MQLSGRTFLLNHQNRSGKQAEHIPAGSHDVYLSLAVFFHFAVEYHLCSFGKVQQPCQQANLSHENQHHSWHYYKLCSSSAAPPVPLVTMTWAAEAFLFAVVWWVWARWWMRRVRYYAGIAEQAFHIHLCGFSFISLVQVVKCIPMYFRHLHLHTYISKIVYIYIYMHLYIAAYW